jgi:hypothetical protein
MPVPPAIQVMDDSFIEIHMSLHTLDERPLPPDWLEGKKPAGLSVDERLALCRRLLLRATEPGRHVVWLAFDNAKLVTPAQGAVGPITFYNGQGFLKGAVGAEDKQELMAALRPNEQRRFAIDQPQSDNWVLVRVDLGNGHFSDPVKTAREQVKALIHVVAFHAEGTSWRMTGHHLHLLDGVVRRSARNVRTPEQRSFGRDTTGETLWRLAPHMQRHLPVTDPKLHSVLEMVGALPQDHRTQDPASTLLQCVRVIEAIAGQLGEGSWQDHLRRNVKGPWALDCVLNEIYTAVSGAMESDDLWDLAHLPKDRDLLHTDPNTGAIHADYVLGHTSLAALKSEIPMHHPAARAVRTAFERTKDTGSLQRWLNQYSKEFFTLIERLARYRNALAHGGPYSAPGASLISPFALARAQRAAHTALWAVIDEVDPKTAQHQAGDRVEAWQSQLRSASSVADAIRDITTKREAGP